MKKKGNNKKIIFIYILILYIIVFFYNTNFCVARGGEMKSNQEENVANIEKNNWPESFKNMDYALFL